ncbi:MAG: alpha-galactosidase [Prevotella sp.]|nr:alpha-galactosidase [Prevotella sp.]
MKTVYLIILILLPILSPIRAQKINEGAWNVVLDESTKTITVSNGGKVIFQDARAEADCAPEGMEMSTLRSTEAADVFFSQDATEDCFGSGRAYVFTYCFDSGIKMMQTLDFYDGTDYMICSLSLTRDDGGTVKSNRMSPLWSESTVEFLPQDKNNRMIFVPWDNDGFISYSNNYLHNNDMYSHAVTAVYNYTTRYGVVAGAVDHDLWKSAVRVNPSEYYKVDAFALVSGYTDADTRDVTDGFTMPHGTVVGDTISSSRFMVGCFDDWRRGLETFGDACALVEPRREWDGGKPYGWNSWGVMATKVSYQGTVDTGDFLKENLVPLGFHDNEGRIVLSLDSWWNENFTSSQISDFVAYCDENDMIPGLYYGPFCYFGGSEESLNNIVPGTDGAYKYKDIALKQNGQYKLLDGAYCLDPTHTGTKLAMVYNIDRFKKWGIKYLKCDFMSQGAIEADSWSDASTGVEAYNKGMKFFLKQLGDDVYVNLSIAPIFPYQYAHGRRISCDAWGTINDTKYEMNSLSYGWWLNQIYFANDPDHLVLKGDSKLVGGNVEGYETDGINRARLTSGLVTGAFLLGDNFSDNVDAGYPELSREQAVKLLSNENINEIPRTCGSFRPVEGSASGTGQEKIFSYNTGKYLYVAVFNYDESLGGTGTIDFDRIDTDADDVAAIEELWTGTEVMASETGFSYSVPYRDARMYRLSLSYGAGIKTVQKDGGISITGGKESVTAESPGGVKRLSVYDIQGKTMTERFGCEKSLSVRMPSVKGIYLIKTETADGEVRVVKMCL